MLYEVVVPAESMSKDFQTLSNLPGSNNPLMRLTRYKFWRFAYDCVDETFTTVDGQGACMTGVAPPPMRPLLRNRSAIALINVGSAANVAGLTGS
jgi:hypothetical protein